MWRWYSPLRYPGGKTSLLEFLAQINFKYGPFETYIEAFAGGAGAALGLLYMDIVDHIILNDLDEKIYAFWHCVLNETEELTERIDETLVDMDTWRTQKQLLFNKENREQASILDIGFATFYVNRCNRSGILTSAAGPIGGQSQVGKYPIYARFNKEDLIQRIQKVSLYKNRIDIYNENAISFIENTIPTLDINTEKTILYMDPPYYEKGNKLYSHHFKKEDHQDLHNVLLKVSELKWILSYDDHVFIRELYEHHNTHNYNTNHNAHTMKVGKELIISCEAIKLPKYEKFWIKDGK